MKKLDKKNKALHEVFQQAYLRATPSADFDKLLEEAFIDDKGMKHIDYDAYVLDNSIADEIIQEVYKKYKITSKLDKQFISYNYHLGASPRSIFKN
jgi:hypothetical protein